MSAQVAADLRAAADVLARDGWKQETYGSPAGCKCLYGALHYIASDGEYVTDIELSNEQERRADWLASQVMPIISALDCNELIDWNDAPGRTADEVIDALRAAAAAADAAEAQA